MDPQHTAAEAAEKTGDEAFRTNGIRHNRKLTFHFDLTGKETYELRHILEELTVETHSFMKARECVHFWDRISEQAAKQGF